VSLVSESSVPEKVDEALWEKRLTSVQLENNSKTGGISDAFSVLVESCTELT